ncbi:hypothetical protein LSTR_LSTR015375 [Laodelphax striatellus]|uniref:Uncharacterized protein n=1 Tax=Laodelphax striatellus TaxID=195883 RepID=A0A482XJN8_LAOST|nr:hypothetical protein LSTR_LSTR015375 [Laodelphax striatellus]
MPSHARSMLSQPTHLCPTWSWRQQHFAEVTTPNPEATNNTDETAPRERDAGSITSANFDPENLRQLSSTRLDQRSSRRNVPPRTPYLPLSILLHNSRQNELSPLTSRVNE